MADGPPDRRLVDYEGAAARYDRGRSLHGRSMDRWRRAVATHLPDGPLRRVIDVGAGTGMFLAMWADVGADAVLAVEPSPAMRARAVARRVEAARVVAGSASHLPVSSGSADVLWLSAVIHHVGDLDAAATELRRALRPEGRALVRGFFPDRSTVPWLDHLPGADRARARFPTTGRVGAAFAHAGLVTHDIVDIVEPHRPRAGQAADWIEAMRATDSILTALTDGEIAAGVAALRQRPHVELDPVELTLLTAVAR